MLAGIAPVVFPASGAVTATVLSFLTAAAAVNAKREQVQTLSRVRDAHEKRVWMARREVLIENVAVALRPKPTSETTWLRTEVVVCLVLSMLPTADGVYGLLWPRICKWVLRDLLGASLNGVDYYSTIMFWMLVLVTAVAVVLSASATCVDVGSPHHTVYWSSP
jgi:hypothetical protein